MGDHGVERVENGAFPVGVVASQLGRFPGVGACHHLLDLAQQGRDVAVLLDQPVCALQPVLLNELIELLEVHDFSIGRGLTHNVGTSDGVDDLLNDAAVLLHLLHDLLERVDGAPARLYELRNAQAIPVQGVEARVQAALQLAQLLGHELALNGAELLNDLIVVLQHMLQALQPLMVLHLLQGHIQGDLRDGEPHAVQVPRLTNELDEVCVEVDLHTARHDGFDEDGLLEVLHRNGVDGVAPRAEQLLLIEHDGLGKAAELGLHVAADFCGAYDLFLCAVQLDHGLLEAGQQRTRPLDGARNGRLILGHWRRMLVLLEDRRSLVNLSGKLLQDVVELVDDLLLNGSLALDVLEVLQQLACPLCAAQLAEAGVNELTRRGLDVLIVCVEGCFGSFPLICVGNVEQRGGVEGDLHLLNRLIHGLHALDHAVNALHVSCHSLELWAQEHEEVVHDLHHLNQVVANLCHVVGAGKQQLLGKLPARIALALLNFLTDLHVPHVPVLQHRLAGLDQLQRLLRWHAEDLAQIDCALHTVPYLLSDALEQAAHALIVTVVAADDPHHAQRIHHRGQGVQNTIQWPPCYVFKVALQGGQELHVISSLRCELGQLSKLALKACHQVPVIRPNFQDGYDLLNRW
mmetsp:Transcript_10045/g.27452  ORF Transcript_10045/g.27452 Transcript_10045/m.27452 type:complete len:633 (-) Transcript_10045:643-2541(-)